MDRNIISYLSRKLRKEKGLTQENASFGGVSKGTIHNIETQEKPVSIKTVLEHFENLGIIKTDFPNLVKETSKDLEDTEFTLKLIQMLIDGGKLEEGLLRLKKIKLPTYHPFYSYRTYILARYYFHKGEWQQAKRNFRRTIEQYQKNQYKLNNQLIGHCYNLLGLCSYYEHNLEQAIEYANLGLKNATNALKSSLLSNLTLYLTEMGNDTQAFYKINMSWGEIIRSDKITTRLNIYLVKTILLRRAGQIDEAIQCAKKGLDLAFLNNEYNRAFELLNTLGNIYLEIKKWDKAEECFQTVLLSGDLPNAKRLIESRLNLAALEAYKENWDESEKQIQLAKKVVRGRKELDTHWQAIVNIMYGEILMKQKKYEQAFSVFDTTIKLAKKSNRKDILQKTLPHALDCLLALKREDKYLELSKELHSLDDSKRKRGEFYAFVPWRW